MSNTLTTFMPDMAPTQIAGLERLRRFVPRAGADYARLRNFDHGAGHHKDVSGLSPYLRHRLITEEDVLRETLARHSPRTAEKFIQEVIWRGYWKGWLEHRPTLWRAYQSALMRHANDIQTQETLRARWKAACSGETRVAPFDAWAQELVRTGYLHNHARMWFASIWIFTLRLPWELGADFFLRHLIDGDPASNTLGWRWVAGLHTVGKTYRADPENIAKYTGGRFSGVAGLAHDVAPVDGTPNPDRTPLPASATFDPALRTGLILHLEDLHPDFILDRGARPVTTLPLMPAASGPWSTAPHVTDWRRRALVNTTARLGTQLGVIAPMASTAQDITKWARDNDLAQIVTPYAPVSDTAEILGQILAHTAAQQIRRPYDDALWPHATHGFFRLKRKIPEILQQLDQRQPTLPGL